MVSLPKPLINPSFQLWTNENKGGHTLEFLLLSGKACILGPRLRKYTCFMASSAETLFLDSYYEKAKNCFINFFSKYCNGGKLAVFLPCLFNTMTIFLRTNLEVFQMRSNLSWYWDYAVMIISQFQISKITLDRN